MSVPTPPWGGSRGGDSALPPLGEDVPDPSRPGRRPDASDIGPDTDRPGPVERDGVVATGLLDQRRHVVESDSAGRRARCGAAVGPAVPGATAAEADCPDCGAYP